MNFNQANNYLTSLDNAKSRLFTEGLGMERSERLLELIGSPQEDYRSIHIAGTSGKGTTATIISKILSGHKKQTGLHVSPHVYDIRERFQINNQLISKQDYIDNLEEIIPSVETMKKDNNSPTYFETSVALAFNIFKNKQIDYGVIEVGLGGLYDCTNHIKRSDKLAVITTLGLDHVEVLGNTLEKIAHQKSGILPFNGHALALRPEDASAEAAIAATAKSRSTDLEFIDIDNFSSWNRYENTFSYQSEAIAIEDIRLSIPGRHQITNATLALRALEYIAKRDNIVLKKNVILDVMANISLPGRFELVNIFDQDYIFDGAHNPQKLTALMNSIKQSSTNANCAVIALSPSKDTKTILTVLAGSIENLIITKSVARQDMGETSNSQNISDILELASTMGFRTAVAEPDNLKALKLAKTFSDPGCVVVTGSFYLLRNIRERLSDTV